MKIKLIDFMKYVKMTVRIEVTDQKSFSIRVMFARWLLKAVAYVLKIKMVCVIEYK